MRTTTTPAFCRLTTAIVCTALVWMVPAAHTRNAGTTLIADPLTGVMVDRGAAKYKRAVSALAGIGTMSLKTEADFKSAQTIIGEHTDNLRFVKYRMIQIALSNAAFSGALEVELNKARSNEGLVLQRFRQNPNLLKNLAGARSTQLNIAAELKRDFQKIKAASERLASAASAITNRRASIRAESAFVTVGFSAPAVIDNYFEALFAASTVIAGARSTSRPATKAPAGGSDGGGSGGSGGGSSWAQDEDEYRDCARQAGEKRERCKGNCGAGLFQWACLANCDASYLLAKATCAISSIHAY